MEKINVYTKETVIEIVNKTAKKVATGEFLKKIDQERGQETDMFSFTLITLSGILFVDEFKKQMLKALGVEEDEQQTDEY